MPAWFLKDLHSIWNWFSAEKAKAAIFLAPLINELESLITSDVSLDLSTAASAVATAFAGGTPEGELLGIAYDAIKAAAGSQLIKLSEEAVISLAASLSAGVKTAVASA